MLTHDRRRDDDIQLVFPLCCLSGSVRALDGSGEEVPGKDILSGRSDWGGVEAAEGEREADGKGEKRGRSTRRNTSTLYWLEGETDRDSRSPNGPVLQRDEPSGRRRGVGGVELSEPVKLEVQLFGGRKEELDEALLDLLDVRVDVDSVVDDGDGAL